MSWWGKLIGGTVGFMFAGPLGGILGAAVGHGFDKARRNGGGGQFGYGEQFGYGDQERVQMAFFTATFSVMGYLAKADGKISEQEIAAARNVMAHMQLTPDQQRTAVNLFNQGKRHDFPLDDILEQFRRECQGRRNLIRMFLEILLGTAMADGEIDASELRILYYVCERIGYPRAEFERIIGMMQAGQQAGGYGDFHRGYGDEGPRLKDAYGVLGLSEEASDDDVKKSYRRLMSQYHPDKLVSKGLPEEMMKFATEKTQGIKAAYDLIKEARKLN